MRGRKKGTVIYTPGDRARAKANGLALATLDIDGRKDRYLIQGVITIEQERVLRRFMLEFGGTAQIAIDRAMVIFEEDLAHDPTTAIV